MKWITLFLFSCTLLTNALAEGEVKDKRHSEWATFDSIIKLEEEEDRKKGLSYMISGALALGGGIVGSRISEDPFEKVVYSVFQSIGIASIGYGAYKWKLGGQERIIHSTLKNIDSLDPKVKSEVLESYFVEKKKREKRERKIKAITHVLIAGVNTYAASRQQNKEFSKVLYFLAGINFLAAATFTF